MLIVCAIPAHFTGQITEVGLRAMHIDAALTLIEVVDLVVGKVRAAAAIKTEPAVPGG